MEVYNSDLFISTPLVSVAVITYNHQEYISECLDNIINQVVDFPFEIIVADDDSTDRTKEICIGYQKKYPEIVKLILNENNQGLIKNYLNVLSHCRGKYIAQIAGDDYWCDVNKLSIQKSFLDYNTEVGLVYTNTYRFSNGVFQKDFVSKNVNSFEEHLIHEGYLAPNSWMYRTECSPLKFLSDDNAHYVDESYAYLLDIFKVSKVAFIPQYMAVYRVHIGSLSCFNSDQKKYLFCKGIFEIKKDYIKKYDISNEILVQRIYMDGYLQLIEDAIILDDKQFINEIKMYLNSHKITFNDVEILINKTIKYRRDFINIKNSKAYRLGKFFTKSFKFLRKMFL